MPVNFHQKHCIQGLKPLPFLGTKHCGYCGEYFTDSDFYGIYDWKNLMISGIHKPECECTNCVIQKYTTDYSHPDYCYCPTCWPKDEQVMKTGPNMNNPMNHEYRYNPLYSYTEKEGIKTMEQQKPETIRGQILDTAKGLTTGDRNKSYGPPIDNLTTYANLIAAYIEGRNAAGTEYIDAVDAAIFMVLAKISRIVANRGHKDNYVDGAAYMAIAGECDELLGG